jgi:ATP-binding cassette subfamily B protein
MPDGSSSPILLRTVRRLSRSWPRVLLAVVLLVSTTLCALSGPWILRYAVDHGLRDGHPDLTVIRNASTLFLVLALSSVVMSRTHTRLTATSTAISEGAWSRA